MEQTETIDRKSFEAIRKGTGGNAGAAQAVVLTRHHVCAEGFWVKRVTIPRKGDVTIIWADRT